LLGLSMFLTGVLLEVFDPRTMGVINGLLYFSFGFIFLVWSLKINVKTEREKILKRIPSIGADCP
ncbi:MAG TPA: hypothetical protein VK190_08520, partial [Pseudoneobacillus sp.]|nr:hypothetical protein [Pseudoneobacillus sp.]